jgi:protein ImuB
VLTVPAAIVPAGAEAAALAPLPIALVARLAALDMPARPRGRGSRRRAAGGGAGAAGEADVPLALWRRWGLATLGALAALPAADLFERLGAAGLAWHAMARGLDARPLVPTAEPQPFEATCAFEWPIEAIEPLSFALGRVIDPLCARLDHDGLGTVTLQTTLRLVTRELYVRRLGLPMPMRDPRVLRTLIVLDLESHPPPAGIDVLTVTFEPVAGRIVQPSLLARAHPRPEAIATLTARLRAVMGDGRVGRPVALDTHRGGAIGMRPFDGPTAGLPLAVAETPSTAARDPAGAGRLTLRRFRQPPAVRVELDRGRPVRVWSLEPWWLPRLGVRGESAASHRDGRGARRSRREEGEYREYSTDEQRRAPGCIARRMQRDFHHGLLGAVRQSAGPWRSSGDWWRVERATPAPSVWQPDPSVWSDEPTTAWDEDEWDVVFESGTAVRLARDRRHDTWVVAALID